MTAIRQPRDSLSSWRHFIETMSCSFRSQNRAVSERKDIKVCYEQVGICGYPYCKFGERGGFVCFNLGSSWAQYRPFCPSAWHSKLSWSKKSSHRSSNFNKCFLGQFCPRTFHELLTDGGTCSLFLSNSPYIAIHGKGECVQRSIKSTYLKCTILKRIIFLDHPLQLE